MELKSRIFTSKEPQVADLCPRLIKGPWTPKVLITNFTNFNNSNVFCRRMKKSSNWSRNMAQKNGQS